MLITLAGCTSPGALPARFEVLWPCMGKAGLPVGPGKLATRRHSQYKRSFLSNLFKILTYIGPNTVLSNSEVCVNTVGLRDAEVL